MNFYCSSWWPLVSVACVKCAVLISASHIGMAQSASSLSPIAQTTLGDNSLQVYSISPKDPRQIGWEERILLLDPGLVAQLSPQNPIDRWERTRRTGPTQAYVLGLLLRDADGRIPGAEVKASTAYRLVTDGDVEVRQWPLGCETPAEELCQYTWNYPLIPLVVEVPKEAQSLKRLEGFLLQVPRQSAAFTVTKQMIESPTALTVNNVTLLPLAGEGGPQGYGFRFAVFRTTANRNASAERSGVGSRDSQQKLHKALLTPMEATLTMLDGEIKKHDGLSSSRLSKPQRDKILSIIRKNLETHGENELDANFFKDSQIELIELFFAGVDSFESLNVAFNTPSGTPALNRFVLEDIQLVSDRSPEQVTEFVSSLPKLDSSSEVDIQASPDLVSDSDYRTWQDKSGKFSVVAKMLRMEDGKVLLEKEDGKQIAVPLDRLGDVDREYLRSWIASMEDGAESGAIEPESKSGRNPDKTIAGKKLHLFENYSLQLPNRFERKNIPDGMTPKGIKLAIWDSMIDERTPEAIVMAGIVNDPRLRAEFKSARQTLINISAGATDQMGIKILGWGEAKESNINGIPMTHLMWYGKMNEQEIGGKLYGSMLEETFVYFILISFADGPDKVIPEFDKHMQTFKQR